MWELLIESWLARSRSYEAKSVLQNILDFARCTHNGNVFLAIIKPSASSGRIGEDGDGDSSPGNGDEAVEQEANK